MLVPCRVIMSVCVVLFSVLCASSSKVLLCVVFVACLMMLCLLCLFVCVCVGLFVLSCRFASLL